MRIERKSCLDGARQAGGIVVIIDVLRAFTCAALMFHYGIEELVLTVTPEEALEFRRRDPNYLAAGEVGGVMVSGFDVGNSPREILTRGERYFKGRKAVLRSSSGTQGAIAASHAAREIILGSYMTASAIAQYIKRNNIDGSLITLVAMGQGAKMKTIEDERCGDYIEHLLTNTAYSHLTAMWECLIDSFIANSLDGEFSHMPKEDVILALQRDLFNFVMVGRAAGKYVIVQRIDS